MNPYLKEKAADQQKANKQKDVAIAGSASVATTGAGIALMVCGGPIGIIAGGIILGAGVSGTVSTTQQALKKDQEDFDYKKWGITAGIGAAGGIIAAPISAAGGVIAGSVAISQATKVGVLVGAEVAGGIAAGAGTKMMSNAYEGKELTDGVLKEMVIRGVTGGIASGVGIGTSHLLSTIHQNAERVLIHTTAGALLSGTTGGLGCLLSNIMDQKKIDQESMVRYLEECGAKEEIAEAVWEHLLMSGYISKDNEFTQQCEQGIVLDCGNPEIDACQDVINDVYQLTKDVWRGVWQSAAESAAIGGVLSGVVTSTKQLHQKGPVQGKTFNKPVKSFLLLQPKPKATIENEHLKVAAREAHDLASYEHDTVADERVSEQQEWTLVEQAIQEEGQESEFTMKTVWANDADEKVLFELRDSIVQNYLRKSATK